MWANKWLSQTLHILNTTAKGGIVAEEDAFADMTEAEDKWAQPDTIVWATTGAMSQQRIMPRARCSGFLRLFSGSAEIAIEHFEKSLRLDPRTPRRPFHQAGLGACQALPADARATALNTVSIVPPLRRN
jgi:hypothetical protein